MVAEAASLRDEYVFIRSLREQSVRQGCFFAVVVDVFFFGGSGGGWGG